MKLTRVERVQLFYDLLGTLFSALMLGAVCSFMVNPSSNNPAPNRTVWEQLHFVIPFVFYLSFLYLFWRIEYFKGFRLNFNWFFVSASTVPFTLFFTVFIRDIKHQRFFTTDSKFLPFEDFLFIVGFLTFVFVCLQFSFWLLGVIHRAAIGNDNETILLNLNLE